jgi:hypothetical protein
VRRVVFALWCVATLACGGKSRVVAPTSVPTSAAAMVVGPGVRIVASITLEGTIAPSGATIVCPRRTP